ncbi:MAG TPA: DUF2911 domain-containing protein [Longimicrobiaceae bacterium]|nr:DUF2911 domain-containing protein [Longimicrobiaceae bacterium]
MIRRWTVALAGMVALAACGAESEPGVESAIDATTTGSTEVAASLVCEPSADMPVTGRTSPYDSVVFALGGEEAKLCYGRPSSRGRTMIGGELVPYGQLWRTGANEPTIIHLPFAATIAGIAVEPGSYSLYTIPGEEEWTVIVNRSISQWGHESEYTPEVEAQEVGRATVPSESIDSPVETFTITADPSAAQATELVLEWENTRVRIPVERTNT